MFRPRNPDSGTNHQLAHIGVYGRSDGETASPYIFPNSIEEAKRLDLQHYLLRQMLQSNIVAPVGHTPIIETSSGDGRWSSYVISRFHHANSAGPILAPRRILDVGCGTGRWAVEIARQFPDAQVVGLDLYPSARPYADSSPAPANYTFRQCNVLQGLPLVDGSFDYVHMRLLSFAVPSEAWQPLMNELSRVTAPGGWVESIEWTLPTDCGPAFTKFSAALAQILQGRGIDLANSRSVDMCMRRATPTLGLIQSQMLETPVGAHGGPVGVRMAWNAVKAIHNIGFFFQQTRLFSHDEWEQLAQDITNEMNETEYLATIPFYLAIGQRSPA